MADKKNPRPEDDTNAMNVLGGMFSPEEAPDTEPGAPETDQPAADQDQGFDDYDPGHPLYKEPEPEPEPEPGEQDKQDGGGEQDDQDTDQGPDENANDKQRYQYWQSRYDKLKAEKDGELGSYKEKLAALEAKMDQFAAPQPDQQTKKEPTIDERIAEKSAAIKALDAEVPQPPQKPTGYSEADAYTDPESLSFRYQRQVEAYNGQVTEYLRKRDGLKDELYDLKVARVEEPTKNLVRQNAMSARERELFDNLKNNHKLSADEAQEFVRMMSSPSSLSIDNLVKFYRFQKGTASPSPPKAPANRGKPIVPPQHDAAPPPTKGGAGSKEADTPDDNDMFSSSILHFGKNM